MQLFLAKPRGFCAGVSRAINIVERALSLYGPPIYVRHEVVHNHYVVDQLRQRGAIFIEEVSKVPNGAILVFSAHGVSIAIKQEAKQRNLRMLFDATCPLVNKVHIKVAQASRQGKEVILIGHAGHPEVEGTMGQYNNPLNGIYLIESINDVWELKVKNKNNLCFVTQTTLSIKEASCIIQALIIRFPNIIAPRKDDICYATVNRQEAVCKLVKKADMVLVVGSKSSSNSTRLAELVHKADKPSFLIDSANDIKTHWFKNIKIIGLTAGASAPDILVNKVIKHLKNLGVNEVIEIAGYEEKIDFKIPKALRIPVREK